MAEGFSIPRDGKQVWLGRGSRIGHYVIERQVGAGGMAMVFSAHDESLGRMVALKVLSPALAHDEEFRQRFLRESRSVAAVEESHIVPVYGAGESGGVLYIATRFVAGGDLGTLLRHAGGSFDPDRALSIITQIAAALDAAHHAGLVHRDVKPGNVLIDSTPGRSEHAYLSDFGLSKAASSLTGITASGIFLGTPDYCAPEQVTGQPPVSPRTDQYSLACVAFALLSGTVPYVRDASIATLFAHVQEPVPSLASRRPGLSASVDAVMAKAMAKDPAARYDSCGGFAAALAAALRAPAAPPAPEWGYGPGAGQATPTPAPWAPPAAGTPPFGVPPTWQPITPVTPQPAGAAWPSGTMPFAPPGQATLPKTRVGGPAGRRNTTILVGAVAGVVVIGAGIGVALTLNHHPGPGPASLQSQLTGSWVGSYSCAQGPTGLRLDIQAASGGSATATFTFYALQGNPNVPAGKFTMTGTYSATGIQLSPGHWLLQPANYEMVGLDGGPLTSDGTTLSGSVTTPPCTTFSVTKAS